MITTQTPTKFGYPQNLITHILLTEVANNLHLLERWTLGSSISIILNLSFTLVFSSVGQTIDGKGISGVTGLELRSAKSTTIVMEKEHVIRHNSEVGSHNVSRCCSVLPSSLSSLRLLVVVDVAHVSLVFSLVVSLVVARHQSSILQHSSLTRQSSSNTPLLTHSTVLQQHLKLIYFTVNMDISSSYETPSDVLFMTIFCGEHSLHKITPSDATIVWRQLDSLGLEICHTYKFDAQGL
ncbi:hypothetical protein QQ045_031942 [Rhodiola kirilowii]